MIQNGVCIECGCHTSHVVAEGSPQYICPKCGRTNYIVWAATTRYSELQIRYAKLATDLEAMKNAADASAQQEALEQVSQQVKLISEQINFATQIELKLERQFYVPHNLSRNLSVAEYEFSAITACGSLFLGLFVQEWINQAALNGTAIALLIATLALGGIAVYCFRKIIKANSDLNQAKLGTQTYTVIRN